MPQRSIQCERSSAIPIPPLPEQRRIVGILDEAFDGIATAKANAEKNLQNARALFESHLNAVFTQRGEGWVEKTLGDIAHENHGRQRSLDTPEYNGESGIPYGNIEHWMRLIIDFRRCSYDADTYFDELSKKNPTDKAMCYRTITGIDGFRFGTRLSGTSASTACIVFVRPKPEYNDAGSSIPVSSQIRAGR